MSMRILSFLLLVFSATLSAAPRNVLLIAVDDLRPWLGAYGADYMHTPEMDALAASGRLFERHYVQAPTCGASRYTLLTGLYGSSSNGALIERARHMKAAPDSVLPSMPAWFRQHGYTTVAVGKVSHYPGGFGGQDWLDPDHEEMPLAWDRAYMPSGPWLNPKGAMHGLANGEVRKDSGAMDVFQSYAGSDMAYPDGWTTEAALAELQSFSEGDGPFFLAVGLIRPHLPFGAPANYMEYYDEGVMPPVPHPEKPEGLSTWHDSREFMKYNRWGKDPRGNSEFAEAVRQHYAAAVSYADRQVGRILRQLEMSGLAEDTVVVLWGDHGWHLGDACDLGQAFAF